MGYSAMGHPVSLSTLNQELADIVYTVQYTC
jgi:hypothetical protein